MRKGNCHVYFIGNLMTKNNKVSFLPHQNRFYDW